jgi:multiple antibiotic resistance protein
MTAATAFLLAFPSLFSIVNPIGGALIFNEFAAGLTPPLRASLAWRVGLYSLFVMLGALSIGPFVLNVFGVSLAALRIAGGAVVALTAWGLLMSRESHEDTRRQQVDGKSGDPLDMAFFPLTLPLTTGPGTIAVAIALGAQRPAAGVPLAQFFVGVSAAALANAVIVWLLYRSTERVSRIMSRSGRDILARLVSFLLLCIGVQILLSGVEDAVKSMQPVL